MATQSRDVNFVIRAKYEAGKAFDSVSKALDELTNTQDDLTSSTAKVSTVLDAFARIATTLGTAYSKIQSSADRAASTFQRQENALKETKDAYQSLTAQMEAAQRVQQRMASFVGPMPKGSEKQLQLVEKAYKDLSSQAAKLGPTIASQESNLRSSHYALQEITGSAEKAAAALEKVQTAQRLTARRSLETSRQSGESSLPQMSGIAESAKGAWQESQQGIQALIAEMNRVGPLTREQFAAMQNLRTSATTSKQAYIELRDAVANYGNVLRNQSSTQDQINAAQQRAAAAVRNAQSAMSTAAATNQRSAAAASQAARAANELGNANQSAAGKTTQLEQSMNSLFANSRRSLSIFQRLRGEVLSLTASYVGLYAAIRGANQVIQTSMEMQAIESRLNVVTNGDQSKTAEEMKWIRSEADRLGFSMQVLAGEWSKFAVSAEASNFSMANTRKIFTSVAESGRVLKLNSETISRTFVALTQMMSKGTIQMEELRQQLGEHIPGAFALMAKAAGVSGAELTKMMEKGELTSDYLIKFADVLDKRFGGQLQAALKMTQAEMGRFSTAVTLALDKIANAGTLEAFTEALQQLQQYLRSDAAEVWFSRIGSAVGGVIRGLLSVLENLDLIAAVFVALGTVKGVAYVIALTKAVSLMALEIRTAQTAAIGLRTAMLGMGGPIGIAVGLLAGAFAFLATRVSESETSMVSAKKTVDDISSSYRNGAKSARDWAKVMSRLSELQMSRDLDNLKKTLDKDLQDIFRPFSRQSLGRLQAQDSPMLPIATELQQLAEQARSGQIPLADFNKRLDEIAKSHPQFRELALRMQDTAKAALDSETALRRFEAALRLKAGTATTADKALLGLPETISDVTDALDTGATSMQKYTDAMARLAERVPDLKKGLKFQSEFLAIQTDLQSAFDAAGSNEGLKQAALDRANAATTALRESWDKALITEFSRSKNNVLEQTVALLKQFEGFQPSAKWDVNAMRMGFGSDTVTLDDGSIQKVVKGMTTTRDDALRDLVRRIGEFSEATKRQVGSDRFGAFTSEQQAALTSIAYNYGSLPERIIKAVKTGTNDEIANAVRALAKDNGGVNAMRRNQEADILGARSPELVAQMEAKVTAEAEKHAKLIKDANKSLDDRIAKIGLSKLQAEIYNETTAKGIDLQSKEGQAIAAKTTELWEAGKAGQAAQKAVDDLLAVRKEVQEQIKFNQEQGNFDGIAALQTELEGVNLRLLEAIANAREFYLAMGGPEAELAIKKLDTMSLTINDVNRRTLDGKAINQAFASGAAQAFGKMGDALGGLADGTLKGAEAIGVIWDAFRQFAADFLRQIAQMIFQQLILNMIQGDKGGGAGGFGGAIAGLVKHTGGMVASGGTRRSVSPGLFANAIRLHSGGIAGLKPNEVPAILERGEEVLTANDPRHMANGGGQSAQSNVKVVNAIDSGSFISAGLDTEVGQQAIFNYISANPNAIKGLLGIG